MGSQGGKLLLDHASANEAVARQANAHKLHEKRLFKGIIYLQHKLR